MKPKFFLISVVCIILSIYFFIGEIGRLYYEKKIEAAIKQDPNKVDTIWVPVGADSIRLPKSQIEQHELAEKQRKFLKPFFWILILPDDFSILIASCGLSLFGFVITLLLSKRQIKTTGRLKQQFFVAFLTGIVSYSIVMGIPEILKQKSPNEMFLLAFSLLSGIFQNKFYAILSKKFPNLYN